MSLILIKSPNWPFPVVGPPPPGSVKAVAALSQVFYKVQRDDMDGAGYLVVNSGGFLAIIQGVILGAPQTGSFIHIATDETANNPLDVIPEYLGSHLITQVLGIGQFKTSTPYTINDVNGFITFQDFDITTVKAEVTTSAPELVTYDQQYKIPYNNPVFAFDLKAGMNPSFELVQDTYYSAVVVITAANALGPLTGSAIDTYDHQLFEAQLPRGNFYGANLNGIVLRTSNPGKILTAFENPEFYEGFPTSVSYYVDEDYTAFSPYVLRGNWYDINHNPVAAINNTLSLPFDGFGIKAAEFALVNPFPATAEFLLVWITDNGVGFGLDVTVKKFWRLRALCPGEIIVEWVNNFGGIDSRAMRVTRDASFETEQGLKYVVGGVTDLADNINQKKVLQGKTLQNYILSVDNLSKLDLAAMTGLLRSQLAEILTYDNVNLQYAKVEIDVIAGFSTPYDARGVGNFSFQCTIQLPDNSLLLDNLLTYPI